MKNLSKAVALAVITCGSAVAHAATVLEGDHVIYTIISEGGTSFGNLSVVGDSLTFDGGDFAATSENGTGVTFLNGTIQFDVQAKPGWVLNTASITETGRYYRIENSAGNTAVAVTGQFGLAASPVELVLDAPLSNTTTAGAGFEWSTWSASATQDLGGTTQVSMQLLQNELMAWSSEAGEIAYIDKYGFDGPGGAVGASMSVSVAPLAPVPVPAPLVLLGSGVAAVMGLRKKRKS